MVKQRVEVKPLSINEAYKGRRFKTSKYEVFECEFRKSIEKEPVPEGDLELILTFGLSSKNADWDNPIKATQDCLQSELSFNDRRVFHGDVTKVHVKKGEEFIEVEIREYDTDLHKQAKNYYDIIHKAKYGSRGTRQKPSSDSRTIPYTTITG